MRVHGLWYDIWFSLRKPYKFLDKTSCGEWEKRERKPTQASDPYMKSYLGKENHSTDSFLGNQSWEPHKCFRVNLKVFTLLTIFLFQVQECVGSE